MTVALTKNFLANARGVTFKDSASVTWSFDGNLNELAAAAAGGGGGLTSVGLADTSGTPIYAVTNSPLVANGTLDITLNTQTANKVFAGPTSGGAAQPTFRALVAADIPAGGGSISVTQTTATLPSPARQSHAVVVVDAAVSGTSKIMLTLGGAAPSAVNEWDDIDLLDMNAVPGAGQFTLHARFLNPISGPLLLNYMVG